MAPPSSGFSITRLAIRQHIGTAMLGLAVVVLGLFALIQLPVDLLPSITYPRIGLRLDAPGLVPEVGVDEVTRPLEEALSTTPGVTQVYSQTREGRVSVDLYFEPGSNIDQALNDATAALNRVRDRLPAGTREPRLFKVDPSQLPAYEFALTSPSLSPVALRVFSDEELSRELTRVPGVASVDVSGGVQEAIQIDLDLQRMQASGIDIAAVVSALGDRNQDISGGILRGGNEETATRLIGKFQSLEEIRALQVGPATRQVRLEDVATITDGTEEQRVFVSLNGEPAVKVSIQKQADANTVAAVDGVKARLEQLRQSGLIPEDAVITATLDESRFIRSAIANVATAGLTGAGLAAIAVLLFLGSLRQTLIILLAIPLASLAALVLMALFGLSLNIFSLGGLAMGVGIVVDNAIVMLENIAQAREQGVEGAGQDEPEYPQAAYGRVGDRRRWRRLVETQSQELESALLASTTTNLVSVVPFLLIGGFISLLFNELILTISFAVAGSLAVALTVVPMLAAQIMGPQRSSLGQGFRRRIDGLSVVYAGVLRHLLKYNLLAIALAVLLCGSGSAWLLGQIPQEILPRINTGQANLRAQFPPGTSAEQNRRAMAAIDQVLLEQPGVAYAFTTAGGSLFGTSTNANSLRGSSTITFEPEVDAFAWIERTNEQLRSLPLIDTRLRLNPESVRGLILNNSPIRAEIDVVLQGEDTARLTEAGQQVLAALDERATLGSYRPDADPPSPEIQILPDWGRIADLGLSSGAIGSTLQTALSGTVPTQLQRESRLVDLNLRLPEGSLQRPEQLETIPLFAPANQSIRLGDIARVQIGQAPGEIKRLNQRQIDVIAGSLTEGANLGAALAEVDEIVSALSLPPGVSRLPSAAAETSRQIQSALALLGGLATFLVFVVMAVQYNSLVDPLVIMLTVPLALTGGLVGLWLTETAIGATVIVGAVLLVGIVVNNAIILVELANQIRDRDNVDHTTAILRAAPQRLRPILMTTVTTVLGLLPLALGIGEGSEFLQPLGVVVFSGLSFATLLTLFVIPCFYTLLHGMVQYSSKLLQRV